MGSQAPGPVGILWDYENVNVPSGVSGYDAVQKIRKIALQHGNINVFKAYLEVNDQNKRLRSELQISGVSLTDTPHNGGKEVADRMLQADMILYACEAGVPATIVLISGDRDYAYAAACLRHRNHRIILISPAEQFPHISLRQQATRAYDWRTEVLGLKPIQRGIRYKLAPKASASKPVIVTEEWAAVPINAALPPKDIVAWQHGVAEASAHNVNPQPSRRPEPANGRSLEAAPSSSLLTTMNAARAIVNSRLLERNLPEASSSQPTARIIEHNAMHSAPTAVQIPPPAQQPERPDKEVDTQLPQLIDGRPGHVLPTMAGPTRPGHADTQTAPPTVPQSETIAKSPAVPLAGSDPTSFGERLAPKPIVVPSRSPSVFLADEDQRERVAFTLRPTNKSLAQLQAQESSASLTSSAAPLQPICEEEPPRSPTPMDGVETGSELGEEDMVLDSSPPGTPTNGKKTLAHDGTDIPHLSGGAQPDTAELARQKAIEVANRLTSQAPEVGERQFSKRYSCDADFQAVKAQKMATAQDGSKTGEDTPMEDAAAHKQEDIKDNRDQAVAREREAAARARETAAAYVLKKKGSLQATAAPSAPPVAGPSRQARRPSLAERLTSPEPHKGSANFLVPNRRWRQARSPSPIRRRRSPSRPRSPSPMLVDGRVEYRRPPLDGSWLSSSFGDDVIWITGDETYWERVSRGAWEARNARSRSRSASPARGGGRSGTLPPRSPRRDGRRRCSDPVRDERPGARGSSRDRTPRAASPARARSSSPMGSPVRSQLPPPKAASTLQVPTGPRLRSKTPMVPPQVRKNMVQPGKAPPQFVKATVPTLSVVESAAGGPRQPEPPAAKWKPLKEIVNVDAGASSAARAVSASSWVSAMTAGQTILPSAPTAPAALASTPPAVANALDTKVASTLAPSSRTVTMPTKTESSARAVAPAAAKPVSTATTKTLEASAPALRFRPLILALQAFLAEGKFGPSRSMLAIRLLQYDQAAYVHAGLRNFKQYIEAAAKDGIVYEGTYAGVQWVALEDEWTGAKV
ncbi:NYN domain-containing protein [Schizophyllum fasciatum]